MIFNWIGLIQVLIIAAVVWVFYKGFVRNTQSEKLLRGLFGLAALWVASYVMYWVHLNLLGRFFNWVALFLSISLIVIFQPELRRFMALLGNIDGWRRIFARTPTGNTDDGTVDAIVHAVEYMSARRTGALIVFPGEMDEMTIDKKGVAIDARVSTELLLTIFFNKTPLHDGAVIIERGRIAYAGAILPLSKSNLKWKYGTRHRAALGMSEASNATVLVVSEESGDISVAEKGKITKYDDMKKLHTRIARAMTK